MYFADLSPYAYYKDGGAPVSTEILPALNIGWLDDAHTYPQAEPSQEFVARLWAFSGVPINTMLGFHECTFCNDNPKTYLEIEKDGQKVGFVQAVLTGPLPDTSEYDARAGRFAWGKRMLRQKKSLRSQ